MINGIWVPPLGYYDLGSERTKYSDLKAANVGVQVGKYIADDIAIELGYGVNTGYDDFSVSSLNALVWLGDESDTAGALICWVVLTSTISTRRAAWCGGMVISLTS